MKFSQPLLLASILMIGLPVTPVGGAPLISNMTPRSVKPGLTTEVTITGTDLTSPLSLWTSFQATAKVLQTRQPIMENYDGPQLRVYWMEVEGPLFDQWPPAGNLLVFGKQMQPQNKEYTNQVLHAFVQRAFRRKVDDATVQPFLDLYQNLRENGHRFESAIHTTFKAVLGSPSFLYHYETEGKLDSYSLINRLSYFLWNTMPDQQLRDLADKGMPSRDQLIEQVERMLEDPRADDFIRSFVDNWLGIGKLGEMPPDPQQFADYYNGNLQDAMKRESQLLFQSLLETNGPVLDLLNSDYTYLNERLAQHYGIAGVAGDKFRRVTLPADSRRGGVLTHASVLTVTSNGTATSPVVRGVWGQASGRNP